jgi:ABC-type histidine transport system ATPase subunit
MQMPIEAEIIEEHPSPNPAQPVLRAENVHKTLGTHPVLCGVSLAARAHEVVSVLGASGSGKSTLLRCLNLLEVPDRGDIWFRNERLSIRPPTGRSGPRIGDARQARRVRASLGMVFQSFNLWPHKTVLENVIEGPVHVRGVARRAAVERAEHLLRKVGLIERRDHYPRHLSGGQQQRVAIARALAMEPAALLFDEPTSALDPELTGEVLRTIRTLAEEGRTMILVTHELAFARDVSTRVVFMQAGIIEEQGPAADVLSNPASARLRRFLDPAGRR